MTCGLCSHRYSTQRCPHCTPILSAHDGTQLVTALELCSGRRIRPLSEVWATREAHANAGQRLADEALAQIRATPPRPPERLGGGR